MANLIVSHDVKPHLERRAALRSLIAEYENYGLEVPDGVLADVEELDVEIRNMVRGQRKARLAKLRAQAETLATPEEKRKRIQEQIANLEAQDGKA